MFLKTLGTLSQFTRKWVIRFFLAAALIVFTLLAVRTYDMQQGPKLQPWHTFVPHEMNAKEIDQATWTEYLQAEDKVFAEVRTHVTDKLDPSVRVEMNRYYEGSANYPEKFTHNWNRSYILEPEGEPKGTVVLLHGLTDSPYSLRHLAEKYRQRGYVAIGIRMPAHGTVPAALADVDWEDWMAATRLAVREAKHRSGEQNLPLHIVGYSNGAALAMKYTLDALDDPALEKPDRLVLISPMIGINGFARFAGVAGWPAIFPPFAKAAWLNIVPEFNPFKYNSFPVNAARESYLLTQSLQQQIALAARNQKLGDLPPIISFQSAMDNTVSASAVITALYDHLPANGSEVVFFDLNQTENFGTLLNPDAYTTISRLLPPAPRNYKTTVVTNLSPQTTKMIARTTEAGQIAETTEPLDSVYPDDVYSLSHVALPFPVTDSLYGQEPEIENEFGMSLGTFAARGEISVLVVSLDSLMRMTSNPFYAYLEKRIDAKIETKE